MERNGHCPWSSHKQDNKIKEMKRAVEKLRVNLRTYALEEMVQVSNSSAGVRTIKRPVEQTLQDLGVCLYYFNF
ncbi:hypothetical protein P8452_48880 [Trifolium repens]|nr:hypothetical protein P8452_48880 [Trifolium repens]